MADLSLPIRPHTLRFDPPTTGEPAYETFGKRGSVRWITLTGTDTAVRCTVSFRRRWKGKWRIRVEADNGYTYTMDGS